MTSPGADADATALGRNNPFPGLRPYEEQDSAWFFGRGREVNELLKRLRRVRFLAVVGPSGCGKSSLIKAGILPAIRDGYLDATWRIASMRPGNQPLENLAAAVAFTPPAEPLRLRKTLESGPLGLVNAIAAQSLGPDTNVLILVDQFEELFQFVQRKGDAAQDEAKSFLKILLTAAASDEAPIYIIVTMRLEWLNECASYAGLAEAINEGIYVVPQMSRRQFQQIILGPIEAAEGSVTAALADRMLNDLDGRADQLPVLQHALMRMWQRCGAGKALDLPAYVEIGTFSNSLSQHADEIFKQLDDDERQAAELLFRSITQVSKNRKSRRPRPLGEIAEITGASLDLLKTVVRAFQQHARSFIVTTPGELGRESVVDISHEALIRQWDRLNKWVEDEAEMQSRVDRLEDASTQWNTQGRKNRDLLYRGSVLKQAERLRPRLQQGSPCVAFLQASRRAERWSQIRWRGLTGLVTFMVIAGLFAWVWYKKDVEKNAEARLVARKEKTLSNLQESVTQQTRKNQEYLRLLEAEANKGAHSDSQNSALMRTIQAKRVYLQYAGDQQAELVKTLEADLRKHEYVVPGDEKMGDKAPPQTQVRYFHREEKAEADKIAEFVQPFITDNVSSALIANPNNVVPAGQFELWLGAGTQSRRGTATGTPSAPPGLAFLLQNSVLPAGAGPYTKPQGAEGAVCDDDIEGSRGCHTEYPAGCTKAGRYDAYLNLLKNQLVPPSTAPVKFLGQSDFANLESMTPRDLARGNHGDKKDDLAKLGEGRVFAVNGYLYYAHQGSAESCNCQLNGNEDTDYHIGIGFDAALPAKLVEPGRGAKTALSDEEKAKLTKTSIVVEMTPHYRAQFQPFWSLDLVRSVIGRQVRVVGQLMEDNEHNNPKDNCAYPGANQTTCSRASIWELHPVTQFQVCRTAARCADDSSDWVNLEGVRRQ